MILSQVQSQVAAALRAAYPGVEVREDDGNIEALQRDDLASTGRTISVLPMGTVKPISVLNGDKMDVAVTFAVGLLTAPTRITGPSPISNPQDELVKIMATVCAVGRGPAHRAIEPSPDNACRDLGVANGAWTYLFSFTVRLTVNLKPA